MVPCPAGKFGSVTGASSEAGCTDCIPGFYCPEGTAGAPTYSLKCPPGHYCPQGTKTAEQNPCPDTKFGTELGFERSDQCKDCKAGYTCKGGDPTGDTLCPAGHYCPAGQNEIKCAAGTYTEEQGATSRFLRKFVSYIVVYFCKENNSYQQMLTLSD